MTKTDSGFYITKGKGFHIKFDNGWTISVQFGPGNYCDNYNMGFSDNSYIEAGLKGSRTAECEAWGPDGEMVNLPLDYEYDTTVSNRSDVNEVLRLINWVASK